MQNTPFDRYIAAARRRPQLWRLFLGVVLIGAVSFLFTLGPIGLIWLVRGPDIAMGLAEQFQDQQSPRATLLLLSTFWGMALGTILAVRLLHRRGAASLFGARYRLARDFALSAGVVLTVYLVGLMGWLIVYTPEASLSPGRWLILLPLALLGVALQTGAEELAFRGYLMQQLAARFSHPAVYMVLPAVAFGAVHFDPVTAGQNAWIVVASATVFGLIAADLTKRTGSLGAAWGFHFANNVFAIVVISTKGTITGVSLLQTPYAVDDGDLLAGMIFADLGMLIVAWLILRRLLVSHHAQPVT